MSLHFLFTLYFPSSFLLHIFSKVTASIQVIADSDSPQMPIILSNFSKIVSHNSLGVRFVAKGHKKDYYTYFLWLNIKPLQQEMDARRIHIFLENRRREIIELQVYYLLKIKTETCETSDFPSFRKNSTRNTMNQTPSLITQIFCRLRLRFCICSLMQTNI